MRIFKHTILNCLLDENKIQTPTYIIFIHHGDEYNFIDYTKSIKKNFLKKWLSH